MSSEEIIEYEEEIGYEETIQDDEPVPEWHLQLIEERMARYEKEGMQGIPLEEFEKELFELLFSQKLLKE